jgi:hypothetical protein
MIYPSISRLSFGGVDIDSWRWLTVFTLLLLPSHPDFSPLEKKSLSLDMSGICLARKEAINLARNPSGPV